MTRSLPRTVLAALLTCAMATPASAQKSPPAPAPHPSQARVDQLVAEANQYFTVGNFEGALAAFREAYTLIPTPDFLYAMATIEEQRGGCAAAIELYEEFLALEPPPPALDIEAASAAITACKDKLGIDDKPPPEDPGPLVEDPVPDPRDEVEIVHHRWYQDVLGLSLVGAGVLGLGGGGVAYGLARANQSDAEQPGITAEQYDIRWQRAQDRRQLAVISASVGGALVIAGVVRLMLADRTEERPTVALTGGPGDLGLALSGHF